MEIVMKKKKRQWRLAVDLLISDIKSLLRQEQQRL